MHPGLSFARRRGSVLPPLPLPTTCFFSSRLEKQEEEGVMTEAVIDFVSFSREAMKSERVAL